jgi:hypothetical protein
MSNFEFSSSVLRGGALATPEKILINESLVTWKQNRGALRLFLAVKSVTIQRKNITGVEIIGKIFGCDLIISTNGGIYIYATCFSKADANSIKDILLTGKMPQSIWSLF